MRQTIEATLPPTISVVMPVHNVEAYVAESIASVRAQSWKTWELIVVNDGSTDNTEGVVRALALEDSRIHLLSQRNAGAASARNRGLEVIRGDFLVFLDGDDLWQKDFMAKAMAMLEGTGTDFFLCGAVYLQANASHRPVVMKLRPGISSSGDLLEQYFAGTTALFMGNVVLRTTLGVRELRFVEGCRHAEDTEYLLRALAMVHSVCFLEDQLFLYRIRPGSATQQAWDWRIRVDAIHAMERALEHLLEHAQDCRKSVLEEAHWQLHFSRYRMLHRMVKSGALSSARQLLAQEGWRKAMHSVAERGFRRKHRYRARIMLSQNALVWQFMSLYARYKSWRILPSHWHH